MQVGDADGAFAQSSGTGGSRAGFGVLFNLFVQFGQVFHAFFFAQALNGSGNQYIAGGSGTRVAHYDLALEFRFQQVVPGFGRLRLVFFKPAFVQDEAQIALVNAGPESVRILEVCFNLFRVGGFVSFQQAFFFGHDEAVGAAAVPQAGLGVVLFRADTAQGLAAGHTNKFNFDAGIFFELGSDYFSSLFYDTHVHNQFFAGFRIRLFFSLFVSAAAACERNGQCCHCCQCSCFFPGKFHPFFLPLKIKFNYNF